MEDSKYLSEDEVTKFSQPGSDFQHTEERIELSLKEIQGDNTYQKQLVFMATCSMIAASTTIYALGMFTAVPDFTCPYTGRFCV